MAKAQILEFTVYLTDEAQVELLNAELAAGGGPNVGEVIQYVSANSGLTTTAILRAPGSGAAIEFAAPFQHRDTPFSAPSTRSPWFGSGDNFPTSVATFTRSGGGWWGWLGFGTTRFYWAGKFAYSPSTDAPTVPVPPDPEDPTPGSVHMSTRRWVDGFELPNSGENPTSITLGDQVSRNASRTVDGLGLALRSTTTQRAHKLTEHLGGIPSTWPWSWERIYVRVRRNPTTGIVELWRALAYQTNGVNLSAGMSLRLAPDGSLLIYSISAIAVETLRATGPVLPLNAWCKLDLVVGFRGHTPQWLTTAPVGNGPGNLYTVGQWVSHSVNFYRCIIRTDSPQGVNDNDPLNFSGAPHWVVESSFAGKTGHLRVYIDGAQAMNVDDAPLAAGTTSFDWVHGESRLGPLSTAHDAEIDVDDWMNAECPVITGGPASISNGWNGVIGAQRAWYALLEAQIDFKAGSHMQAIRPTGFAPDHDASWVGGWTTLLQHPPNSGTPILVTSSTSGARLAVETDTDIAVDRYENQLGVVAMVVGLNGARVGTADGALGYRIDGAEVLAAIDQGGSGAAEWKSVLFAPVDPVPVVDPVTGALKLPPLTPLQLVHTKGADANAASVRALWAVAEIIGIFGIEDLPPAADPALSSVIYPGAHNAPYPLTPWALSFDRSAGPVGIKGGTYVGTGAEQSIPFRVPPHWGWIRPLTGGTITTVRWFSSMLGVHLAGNEFPEPKLLLAAMMDPSFVGAGGEEDQVEQAILRIGGTDAMVNAVGVTYQYIAFCDPSSRFLLNGAFAHTTAVTTAVNPLVVADFLALGAFFQVEKIGVAASARHFFKGPGHLLATAQDLNTTAPVDVAELAVGTIVSGGAAAHVAQAQLAYALWRQDDGEGILPPVSLHTYIGDAVNPRVIAPLPDSERRPMFVIVTPHNAASVYRDPSHTGTISANITGSAIPANGISAGGLGTFSVGSQLNASGIVHDVFVIWGCTDAGNNGWSVNCEVFIEPPSVEVVLPPPFVPPQPPLPPPIEGIDFSNQARMRLTYLDSLLYFDYLSQDENGRTLVYEPAGERWTPDEYVSGVTARLGEPGLLVHSNLIGCESGHIYAFDETLLTDDGTAVDWRIHTPWANAKDARENKHWGDAVLDCVPTGGIDVVPVAINGGVLAATIIPSGVTRDTFIIEVNAGDGVLARNFGLQISGTMDAETEFRPILYLWEPSYISKNVTIARRATDWENLGYQGAKFIQGVVIRANTFNGNKQVAVQYDGGATPVTALTLSIQHNGERQLAYPLAAAGWTPFVAELVRLKGSDDLDWSLLDWRWVWEPAPELATQWETQDTTFDLPGFLTVHDAVLTYLSNGPITLTVWHDNNAIDYTLPSTAGIYQRVYTRFQAAKGKSARFRFVSEIPFRLFKRDVSMRVQGWGVPGGYLQVQPFGGPHRADGAAI